MSWEFTLLFYGNTLNWRKAAMSEIELNEIEKTAATLKMDPIRFEVMRSAFEAAADEMGAALRKASYSTNIKTRADFSCALFDSKLRIIAQSFSQPVHLASMSRMIPNTVRQYGIEKLRPGDALVMNHPYRGGVHLNDVAIMAPFFSGEKLQGYAATIAHHVDIGGYAPGGYCISTEVYQEGIIIPPARLVSEGEIVDDVFNLILANIRSPRQSAGDFRAQIAASLLGQKRMAEIITKFGEESVEFFVDELIDYTERWAHAEISKLPDGVYESEAYLDDDGVSDRPIRLFLKAEIKEGRVSFDLTGSDAQRSSPMNATPDPDVFASGLCRQVSDRFQCPHQRGFLSTHRRDCAGRDRCECESAGGRSRWLGSGHAGFAA